MAKLHAGTADSSGNCHVVIHIPVPAGNNMVSKSWKSCWVANGRNTTSMVEGTGVGQISAVEKASIEAGDTIEMSADVPLVVVKQGVTATTVFVDALVAGMLSSLANELAYYGWTYGS